MFKKSLVTLLILVLSLPAVAGPFHHDGFGVDTDYVTGDLTNGRYPSAVFKANKGFKMDQGDGEEHLLQPELLPAKDFKTAADNMFNDDGNTLAMVLIEKGKIVYQRTREPEAEFNSWSMAKSITAILVGQALCKGDIKSLDDTAESYVPEIKGSIYGRATIKQLLTMTSGSQPPRANGENSGDFFEITRQLKSHKDFINRTVNQEPTKTWAYDNLNTDTLGLVLDSKQGTRYYMKEYLHAAGVEHDSHWIVDKEGRLNTAYGYGARLEDWAHIAQYSLDTLKGRTNDKCMQKYMLEAIEPHIPYNSIDTTHWVRVNTYGYGMWTWNGGYSWLGNFGQKVWVDTKHELIVITFRNRSTTKYVDSLISFWNKWRKAHEPRPGTEQDPTNSIKGRVRVDFVEAPKDPNRK